MEADFGSAIDADDRPNHSESPMKFRLRTLLALVTICGIAAAIILQVLNYREKQRLHRISFDEALSKVKSMDEELEAFILQMPAVWEPLQASHPVDPKIGLAHSISSTSLATERPQFSRAYHYHWQRADGSRDEGIKIHIASMMNPDSFDKHVIELTYLPNELNSEVANWLAGKLKQLSGVRVEMVPETSQQMIRPDN